MQYLYWNETNETNPEKAATLYDQGYLYVRTSKGIMQQTRSVRVNLSKFNLTSENRRILRKGEEISSTKETVPFSNYSWKIGKIAKDFYETKFGEKIFSANKIKELMTDASKSNFNTILNYNNLGYVLCFSTNNILHYSYPFYNLEKSSKDMGLIMMTKMLEKAKEETLSYVYLGSLQRASDIYKLQFEGIEWFDGKEWKTNLEEVKKLLQNTR